MKRKTTKEILAESFRELVENHPVNKITIQEIVDNCDFLLQHSIDISEIMITSMGCDLIKGHGKLVDANTVEANGKCYTVPN